MRDRMTDFIREDIEEIEDINIAGDGLSLFAASADEDPDILKIRKIARELESQSAMMIQVTSLQKDLISFASVDADAAYRSRIPMTVCEHVFETRFCTALTGSFQQSSESVFQSE